VVVDARLSSKQEKLVWPPKREDLERLYVEQHLSAMKIANVYELKYANPKTAESTVLYHLKRNGIERRDAAEHVRKVTEEMANEWAERYRSGESLKQIAGEFVNPVTVWNHLKKRGVALRDKVEAQIQTATKYERKPFKGDDAEKAYLMGLRYGDLNVVRHGRAVRIRLSTTHPAMADLFAELFGKYGHVKRYPREAKLVGFEWSMECDLDRSFEFLVPKMSSSELTLLPREEMVAFLAGLFDAEGSIYLHNKRGRRNPEVSFTNSHQPLLEYVKTCVTGLGLYPRQEWLNQRIDRGGVVGNSSLGRVRLWRFGEVQEFLRRLPIRHQEKIMKTNLVLRLRFRVNDAETTQVLREWEELRARIRRDRDAFVATAKEAIESAQKRKSSGKTTSSEGKESECLALG
jgi:hypothetical protein